MSCLEVECFCGERFVFLSHPKEELSSMVKRWNEQGKGHLKFHIEEGGKISLQRICKGLVCTLNCHHPDGVVFWVPPKGFDHPWQRKKKDALYRYRKPRI